MTKPRPSTVDAFGLRHEPTTGPQAPGRLVPRVTEWKTGQPRKAKPRRSEPGDLAGSMAAALPIASENAVNVIPEFTV